MASALKLEVFTQTVDVSVATWMTSDQIEATRQAAFEAGYAAGWQDSSVQRDGHQRATDEAFEASLQHLAFTHEEIRAQFMTGMKTVLAAMTTAVLPEIARHSLPGIVADLIAGHAGETFDAPLLLLCHPHAEAALRLKLSKLQAPPVTLQTEATLSEGQLALQWPDYECSVNTTSMVAAIGDAVAQFFATPDDAPQQEKFDD